MRGHTRRRVRCRDAHTRLCMCVRARPLRAPPSTDYSSLSGYCSNVAPLGAAVYAERQLALAAQLVCVPSVCALPHSRTPDVGPRCTDAGGRGGVCDRARGGHELPDQRAVEAERAVLSLCRARRRHRVLCVPRYVSPQHAGGLRRRALNVQVRAAFENETAVEQTGPDATMVLWEENESPYAKVCLAWPWALSAPRR
jgi:hypothetical protein